MRYFGVLLLVIALAGVFANLFRLQSVGMDVAIGPQLEPYGVQLAIGPQLDPYGFQLARLEPGS